jgi:hypothetical protein
MSCPRDLSAALLASLPLYNQQAIDQQIPSRQRTEGGPFIPSITDEVKYTVTDAHCTERHATNTTTARALLMASVARLSPQLSVTVWDFAEAVVIVHANPSRS